MKIEISEKSFQFLKNLVHEIETQDNRGTRNPYFYVIQQNKSINKADGYGDHTGIWYEDTFYEEIEFDNLVERAGVRYNEDFDCVEEFVEKISDKHPDTMVYTVDYSYEWLEHDDANIFFTQKGYEEHVAQNKHNLGKHRSYIKYAFRNPEIEGLFEALRDIAKNND